jgi:hypothetical protein
MSDLIYTTMKGNLSKMWCKMSKILHPEFEKEQEK